MNCYRQEPFGCLSGPYLLAWRLLTQYQDFHSARASCCVDLQSGH
jgi:hypothetical protein